MNTDRSTISSNNRSGDQLMQDAEARFFLASITDSLQDSVVTINLQGLITSWNKSAERLYGYPAAEVIGRSLEMVVFPADFVQLLKNIDRIRQGQAMELFDTFRLHKDGRQMHVEVTLSPVKDDRGIVIGVSTVARDVTALRKIEEALRLSESRLRGVFEAATDFGIIVMDAEGIITDWNSGAEKMFGYSRHEAIGRTGEIIFTEEDRHAGIFRVELESAATTQRSIDERWHLHKDGTRFFMSGVMTAITQPESVGFVKVARNITERKLAEEALFISEERKSLAIKSAEMGEWEWEFSTNSIKISGETATLIGIAATQQQNFTPDVLLEYVVHEDREMLKDAVENAFSGLNILKAECRIRRPKSYEVKWVSIYGRVIAHESQQASRMMGVAYDITPRKSLDQQKDDFISLASHELKTPATAIKSYCELLLEQLDEKNATYEISLIRKLDQQVDRMTKLIKNLLDTSMLAEGRIKLDVQPLDLNELVNRNLESLKSISQSHNIIWQPGMVAIINADRERIMQVIANFIANASKYSPAGTDIIISTTDQQDHAVLRVQDQGMGIPSEAQPMIFNRLYRGTHQQNEKGFGLGLYICAEIIKHHNGNIGVTSVPGEGSTFYFSIPYT